MAGHFFQVFSREGYTRLNKGMERRIERTFFLIKNACVWLYADRKEPIKRNSFKIEEKEVLLMKQNHSRAKRNRMKNIVDR